MALAEVDVREPRVVVSAIFLPVTTDNVLHRHNVACVTVAMREDRKPCYEDFRILTPTNTLPCPTVFSRSSLLHWGA